MTGTPAYAPDSNVRDDVCAAVPLSADAATGREVLAANSTTDVAIFLPSLGQGGIERVYLNLAGEFIQQGLRVTLLIGQMREDRRAELPENANVVDFGARRRGALWLLPGYVRFLWHERPKAILASSGLNLTAIWVKLVLRSRARLAISTHNTLSAQFKTFSTHKHQLVKGLMARFYPRADAIIAVSEAVATDMCCCLRLDRQTINVIPNPVVTRAMRRAMDEPITDDWFGNTSSPLILGVGSLIARKDFKTLVSAFARVRAYKSARLVILGEGEERAELEQLIHALDLEDDVRLLGFVDNPYPFFRRASLFVLTSRWEGLPTNLIEALACGCPVIATDCPGGSREILDGGRHGRIVPVGNVDAVADAIVETLDQPPDRDSLRRRSKDYEAERAAMLYRSVLAI